MSGASLPLLFTQLIMAEDDIVNFEDDEVQERIENHEHAKKTRQQTKDSESVPDEVNANETASEDDSSDS